MILEICANSYLSAKNAQDAGAHRVELCQELTVGGITPSYGLLKKALEHLTIPIFVLVRPRSGDFVYTDCEFEIMKNDIEICKALGAKGIVSGVLNYDKAVDVERTKILVELAKPLPFTFHRAFDEVNNPEKSLEQLIDLGIERVLTSGQDATAEGGVDLLEELNKQAKDRIIIMAGSGVSAHNVHKFKRIGLKEIHASASSVLKQNISLFAKLQTYSDASKIKTLISVL